MFSKILNLWGLHKTAAQIPEVWILSKVTLPFEILLKLPLTWLRLVVSPRGQWAEVWLTALGWSDQMFYKQERRVCQNADDWKDGKIKSGEEWSKVKVNFVGNRRIFMENRRKTTGWKGRKSKANKGKKTKNKLQVGTVTQNRESKKFYIKEEMNLQTWSGEGEHDKNDQSWLLLCTRGEFIEPLVDPDKRIDWPGGRDVCRPDSQ